MIEMETPRLNLWKFALFAGFILSSAKTMGVAGPQDFPDEYKTVSAAVILDAVVRDRKGRLITDLTTNDLRIFENGREQEVRSVRLVDSGEKRRPSGPPGATGPDSVLQKFHLISLVFDNLSIDSRRYARQATEDLLKSKLPLNTYIGVFAIDKGLRAVSPFTTDLEKVMKATELATSGSFEQVRIRSRELYKELLSRVTGIPAIGTGEDPQQAIEISLMTRIFENAQAIETELQGQETVEGLRALVSAQKEPPGRKTVLFFSEGIYIPDKLSYLFRLLISEANRSNASIYSVDARGLTSQAQSQPGAQALGRSAALSQSQVQSGGLGGQTASRAAGQALARSDDRGQAPVGAEEMRSLETAADSVRMNVQEALDDLSSKTGGFLTANTNDPSRSLKRLTDELQQYYEIVYASDADPADEGYRQIRVEVNRDGASVQARDGYFPFSSPLGSAPDQADSIWAYETPLIDGLKSTAPRHDFPLKSRSFHLGSREGEVTEVVAASVPFEALDFQIDSAARRYAAHLSVLALVRGEDGAVVAKLSQDYPIEGQLDGLEAIKGGEVMFVRSFKAHPGRYHLEVAAYDHQSEKTATKRQVLVIEQPVANVQLSSLILVKSLEPLSDLEKVLDLPLQNSGHRIIPYAGAELEIPPGGEFGVYCQVYPQAGGAVPGLTIAIFKDGQPLFKGVPDLVGSPGSGQLAALFSIPTEGLAPGTYQLKAWAQQGELVDTQSTVFTLKRPELP
jgi:VWFA-related protein